VRLPSGVWAWPGGIPHKYFILDGHHRVVSARLRGVDIEAVVVG
jgi:ParB-like chromosome segregation protein Spo0J